MLRQPKIVVQNELDILVSGSVISYGWQIVDIYPISETPFHIRLIFEVNSLAPPAITTANAPNETQIKMTNFDQPNGIGTSAPLHIANWMDRKMYLSLATAFIGTGPTATRITHYTIHQGEPTNA